MSVREICQGGPEDPVLSVGGAPSSAHQTFDSTKSALCLCACHMSYAMQERTCEVKRPFLKEVFELRAYGNDTTP